MEDDENPLPLEFGTKVEGRTWWIFSIGHQPHQNFKLTRFDVTLHPFVGDAWTESSDFATLTYHEVAYTWMGAAYFGIKMSMIMNQIPH